MVLNTPGSPDGAFRLEVNGKVALDLYDVFYRDVQKAPQDPDSKPAPPSAPGPNVPPDDGLLGPILGGLLGELVLEDDETQGRASAVGKGSPGIIDSSAGQRNVAADSPALKKSVERRHADPEPIGFKGIFFRCVLAEFTAQSGPG